MKRYEIKEYLKAKGDSRSKNIITQLFSGFTFGKSVIDVSSGEKNTLVIGAAELPSIQDGAEFALRIEENGIAIRGKDYGSFMRGFFSMLMKIERDLGKENLFIRASCENGIYKLKNRMAHLCIFPEMNKNDVIKYIRLLASLQFTHVVIEPWGTVKLDCIPELGWNNTLTKEDLKQIAEEIKMLGMEAIPMLNSLGHASGCRLASGKHVVLDQNPSLYYLFTHDGWAWNLENEKTWELLKKVRRELYEIFDGCSYFHIGFDESHSHNYNEFLRSRLPYYIERLTNEVADEGKRPMLWIDMLLPPEAYVDFEINWHSVRSTKECENIISRIHPSSIFVDWQYEVKKAPISTTLYYKDRGFDIIGASWLNIENGKAHIETAYENNLFGVMLTTWHTLFRDIENLLPFAKEFGAKIPAFCEDWNSTIIATLLRKLMPCSKDYLSSGYSKYQIQ